MASIDLTQEVLRHTDEEIIEFLSDTMADVVRAYAASLKVNDPTQIIAVAVKVAQVRDILRALNRRNEEHKLQ